MTIAGMRILMTTDAVGGVWTYTLDLAAGIAAAGGNVRIAVLGPALRDGQRSELARRGLDAFDFGHTLDWLAADIGDVSASAQAISELATTEGADLVHLHAAAFAADVSFSCPVVVTHHSCVATWWAAVKDGPLPDDFGWRTILVAEGLRRADLVIAPSAAYARAIAELYRLPTLPIVVHNGRVAAPADDCDTFFDEIFTAGRLWDEGKNIAALDRAATLVPWQVYAAGDTVGPNGAETFFDHLVLVGRQTEFAIRQHLAKRPIFVAPALFEPFGLAVLEAAQAGCALVLNDIPTFRELWEGAAVFADADDSTASATAIRSLIDDRPRRRALGSAARTRAGLYSIENMVESTVALYRTCLPKTDRSTVPPQARRSA